MTTLYSEGGAQNVTLVECGAKVSLIRDEKKNGYNAIQLEIDKTKNKKYKKEFRVNEIKLEQDATLDVSIFEIGEKVKVSGISKAKGFQGVVKRHGFAGGPASHGGKHNLRQPGSIGSGFPEHVMKGKRMAGRMGGERITSKNLKIVFIDKEKNILGLEGAVPGVAGRVVEIVSVK